MLIFDLETNGLLHELTTIHCLVIHDVETDTTTVYNDKGNAEPIVRGVQRLEDADCIVGHNIIGFDLPAIRTLYPWFTPPSNVIDTLVCSRILHSDMLAVDKRRNLPNMPLNLYGRHSLESYGYRLGEYKGDYGKTADWNEWSQEMEDYCVQDTKVTTKLWRHLSHKIHQSLTT
ncbi:MAG: hypothetical protein GWN86_10290 [Desulfobacterales bacterium]|nr:hypothetical protein [Desulfobacterales bacterium]